MTRPLTALAALALGVLVGFVLGGVGPRRELVASQEQVAELEEELESAPGEGTLRSTVPGFARILRPPPRRRGDQDEGGDEGRDEERTVRFDAGVPPDAVPSLGAPGAPDFDDEEESPYSAFQRAASVQRVRMVQSRAALVEQGDLDPEEVEALDAALETMNGALVGYGEELLLLAQGGERPPPRELLGITHDVTGILQTAQLELESLLGAERMESIDSSALEIWNHIDLELLEPAARAASERRQAP